MKGYGYPSPLSTNSVYGLCMISDSTSSTSASSAHIAASPSAVKSAYDLANTAKTTATNAQTAANSKASKASYSATLSSSGWSSSAPYTQTVTVSGILATDSPIIDLNMSSATVDTAADLQADWSLVGRITTAANSITAYCYEDKPAANLPLII